MHLLINQIYKFKYNLQILVTTNKQTNEQMNQKYKVSKIMCRNIKEYTNSIKYFKTFSFFTNIYLYLSLYKY